MARRYPSDDVFRALLPRLRRFAWWLTRDAHAADDLVQSTVERALSRWSTKRTDGELRPWLYAIAYRRFLDDRRRARRWAAVRELLGRQPRATQASVEEGIVTHSIVQALDQLPEAQRHLLLWVSVDGLSYREIAALLDIPIGTVMSRLSRARAALRRCADGAIRTDTPLRALK